MADVTRIRGQNLSLVDQIAASVPSHEFIASAAGVAKTLEVPLSWLLTVISFETRGTFRPDIRNARLSSEGNASAPVGLIQFSPRAAKDLQISLEELSALSAVQQLAYVQKYFQLQITRQHLDQINSLSQLYLLVLYPKAANEAADHVVFRAGTRAFELNGGAFGKKAVADGEISVEEIVSALEPHLLKVSQLLRDLQHSPLPMQKGREASLEASRPFTFNDLELAD